MTNKSQFKNVSTCFPGPCRPEACSGTCLRRDTGMAVTSMAEEDSGTLFLKNNSDHFCFYPSLWFTYICCDF